MIDKDKIKAFNKYSLQKVFFYIESNFWSKLNNDTLHKWLKNFDSLEEQYCAAKLLDRFVFYSEEDIIRLLDYGFSELILKRKILELEIENDFQLSNDDVIKVKNDFFTKTLVLPLITGNPSESSHTITRYLTIDLGFFPEKQILSIKGLRSDDLNNANNLIIVDDFIGTGQQISDFWNNRFVELDGQEIRVKQLKQKFPDLQIEYFCLVCTEEGYNNFLIDYMDVGLRITFCEKLSNKFKVFGKDSVYFDNEEVEECKLILEKLCDRKGIDLLGFKGLDYAIAFHHSIPDSSLPIFFKHTDKWHHLFRNKKTV